MASKIFRSIILVAGSILFSSFLLIFGVLYSYFAEQLKDGLRSEAIYIAKAVEINGLDYLKQVQEEKRITLIEPDGTVIYDSKVDINTMENHRERKEIREALENGVGEDTRYSDTLSEQTSYYAVKIENGEILRIAQRQDTVFSILLGLVHPLLYILALMFLLGAFLANKVAKKILDPVNNLDLEHPEQNKAYDEVAPLLTKIYRQKSTIKAQLEEAKKRQEEFEMITENMEEGFLVIGNKMEILSCNTGTKKMFEIDTITEHKNVLTLNRSEKFQKVIQRVLDGKRYETEIEIGENYYQLIANPIFHESHIAGAVIVFVDITEKVAGEHLRKEFTANVSHELKTPLTSISGFAEIMQNGIVKQEDIPKFAGNIFKESQRLISLVNDVIKLSQLDEGMMPYEKEPVNLMDLAKEIQDRLQGFTKKKGVTMQIEGEETTIEAVRPVLEEVLYNLCDNGIKYNKEDGTVTLRIGEKQDGVLVEVLDTGIGIPAASQSRIFERFYCVDKSHSKQIGGTGLGLSIVKHGVAYLKGKITVESTVGVGTKFSIWFPK